MQEVRMRDGSSTREFVHAANEALLQSKLQTMYTSAMGNPDVKSVKQVKLGRNSPCPCGSGIKFKKCCINLSREVI